MKKRSRALGSTQRRKIVPQHVEQYLATLKSPAREMVTQMREAIRSVVPQDAVEVISYRIPAFKRKRVLIWYAGFANHVSLFPTAAVIDEMKSELKMFVTSKGTIQFPIDRPLPTALIKRVVKRRLDQVS